MYLHVDGKTDVARGENGVGSPWVGERMGQRASTGFTWSRGLTTAGADHLEEKERRGSLGVLRKQG